jgi:O-antigen ligase
MQEDCSTKDWLDGIQYFLPKKSMSQNKSSIIERIGIFEWYSLLLCVFSIPLFESPKTIFLVIASLLFFIRRYVEKDYRNIFFIKDPRLGLLSLALAASISAIFAQKPLLAIHGSFDFLKMYLLFIIVANDFSDRRSIKTIVLTVIASTTIASIWGLTEYIIGKSATIELNSVGHVNHSSVYLALSLVLAISMLLLSQNSSEKNFMLISAFVILVVLILSGSRATLGAFSIALIGMFLFGKKKKLFIYIIMAVITTAVITLAFVPQPSLLQKVTSLSDQSLLGRIILWEKAWELFLSHPLIGVGAKHFKFYNTLEFGSHAHSLYFNTLAQLGIVGFTSLAFLFYLVINSLKASYGRNLLWNAALGAFIVVSINGTLNTMLHSEHGLLFSLIVAIGLTANGSNPLACRDNTS